MQKRDVLNSLSSIIKKAEFDDYSKNHYELINYMQGLYDIIENDGVEADLKLSILNQTFFILGYCRGLSKVTNNINWTLLENDITLTIFDYTYASDTVWEE